MNVRDSGSPKFALDLVARTSGSPGAAVQSLQEHLEGVARRCVQFVAEFADPAWGLPIAHWHDLGKAAPDWQDFIRAAATDAGQDAGAVKGRGPAHAALGAIHAANSALPALERQLLAFAIDGHHGGLVDREHLKERVRDPEHLRRYELARTNLGRHLPGLLNLLPPRLPVHLSHKPSPLSLELFTRMLFSALVDADALDAEEHEGTTGGPAAGRRLEARAFAWPGLAAYDRTLEAFMAEKQRSADPTCVNATRRMVLGQCVASSSSPRGTFTLTVPTGGGKTLAGLTFALKHALKHGQRRIVIAVPFTAIIDQTAEVLRGAFDGLAAEVLVEHHSALEPEGESRPAQVAADNWDAPVIVTTQVQLFESLFSNRPSKCRKLHNLTNSIIVLDEVQSLPHGVLAPILDVLNDLVAHYGVTLLLTTATQPSLHTRTLAGGAFAGLTPKPTEIISDSLNEQLWTSLRRVDVRWPAPGYAADPAAHDQFWQELAAEVAEHSRALAIVHLKMDARALYQALNATHADTLHLSAAMCPAHRREVLREVRRRLAAREPCRLVSTQLIEAGVDVDFPVVYRAMAGLESLAQSAGRCNREGKLGTLGSFRVFLPPTRPPRSLQVHLDIANSMLRADPRLDLFSPATFVRYFDQVYAARTLDTREVQALRAALRFESTAGAFRMIDESAESVVVCWDDTARQLVRDLRQGGANRMLLRRLQPYTVSVFPRQRLALERQSALEDIDGCLVLGDFTQNPFYHRQLGLLTEADPSVSFVF